MELFWKITAGCLISTVLCLTLCQWQKELAVPAMMLTGILASIAGLAFLEPIITFFREMLGKAELSDAYFTLLLRILGIGFIGELAGQTCSDAGNQTLGKLLPILSRFLIIRESLFVYEDLLQRIQEIFRLF